MEIPPKSPKQMTSSADLPPELWLIIFDFVVDPGVGLAHQSNYFTFPDILNQIRDPWSYSRTPFPSLNPIRLVCRAFNALAARSYYVFIRNTNTPIPSSALAAFIFPSGAARELLEHLLAEPSKSQRIVILDLPGQSYPNSCVPFLFDFLCEISDSLPNVQALTLGLYHDTSTATAPPNFWSRLNKAFPRLTSLVLRGRLKNLSETQRSVFKRLKILDLDLVPANRMVDFPVLRHVASGYMTWYLASCFTGWAALESLLIRQMRSYAFDWTLLPQLRLLGISSGVLVQFDRYRLPPLLQHLYIYVDVGPTNNHYQDPERKDKELHLMKQVLRSTHVVQQLTLVYQLVPHHLSGLTYGNFDDEEMAGMGFTRYYSRRSMSNKYHCVAFRRTSIQPQFQHSVGIASQGGEGGDQHKGFPGRLGPVSVTSYPTNIYLNMSFPDSMSRSIRFI